MTLLASKLHRPSIPVKSVPRPQLIRQLNAGLESQCRLTLISAPAGFGKTSCAAEWVSSLNLPSAWLSLDTLDDDPIRFFAYLVAALQSVDPHLGGEIAELLNAGQLPALDVLSTSLMNDILELEKQCILVLDDFHVIQEAAILQALEMMLTSLPENMHLVLITREDPSLPLARLRANRQLTEIRAADLRFSRSETACFLNEVMELHVSAQDVVDLEHKTEG